MYLVVNFSQCLYITANNGLNPLAEMTDFIFSSGLIGVAKLSTPIFRHFDTLLFFLLIFTDEKAKLRVWGLILVFQRVLQDMMFIIHEYRVNSNGLYMRRNVEIFFYTSQLSTK